MPNAEDLVRVDAKHPGDHWKLILGGNGLPEVEVNSHPNRAVMDRLAEEVKVFLTALQARS